MTDQPQQPNVAPVDLGNPILSTGRALLSTSFLDLPDGAGKRLVATIRTESTTCTVFLDADQAQQWAFTFGSQSAKMPRLVVPGSPGVPPVDFGKLGDLNGGRP